MDPTIEAAGHGPVIATGFPAYAGSLVLVADAEHAAERAATLVADALVAAVAARGRADWATTGGSTAPGIYRRLASAPLVGRIPWQAVHVWWGDDRYVPPDDERSNVAPLQRGLLEGGVPLPAENVHPFHGLPSGAPDPGIEAAARATADELRAAGLGQHDGYPVFDVVLLGMGPDGHILSVFPGSAAFAAADWALAIPAPTHIEPHVARVTLNPRVVAAARLVVPVVTGAAKAAVLADVLGPDRDPARWPAQLARRPGTTWIVDAAAATAIAATAIAGTATATTSDGSASRAAPRSALETIAAAPDRIVHGPDGAPIAVFVSGPRDAPPVILIHGAAADHTTFRVVAPMLAERFRLHALDRRGRGASGDGPTYAIEREFEDLAAVANEIALETGGTVDVIGHSYGGRIALGASLLTRAIRRVVSYEGAPGAPGAGYHDAATEKALGDLIAGHDLDGALALFMSAIVGMPAPDLAAYRADPVWPTRVLAARTLPREIRAERSAAASLDALAAVHIPVLQVLGGASVDAFRAATLALHDRLHDGRLVVIPGARHAAHHTHPDAFVESVSGFLLG